MSLVHRAGRLPELDLLRIGAALAVVVYHYTFSGPVGGLTGVAFSGLDELTRYGYLGVDLFFTISGFVILLSAWGRRPSEFIISRLVRLYPAFWVAVSLTALVSVILGGGKFPVSLPQFLANLTMVHPVLDVPDVDVVYWTLWAELRFYAVVLLLLWVGLTRRRVLVLLWSWLALTALVQLGAVPSVVDLVVQSTFAHYFIAGMALGLWYRCGFSWQLVVIIGLALGNALHRGVGFASAVTDRYGTPIHSVVVVAVILAIFLVMTLVATRVTARLARPWYAVAGSITYPLYLIHAHVGFILLDRLDGVIARYPMLIGLIVGMCLLAWLIHTGVERPFAPWLRDRLHRAAHRLRPAQEPVGEA